MKSFTDQFLGNHSWQFHLAGFIICLLGVIAVKYHFWKRHKAQHENVLKEPVFSLSYWIKYNWLDVVLSLIVSFLLVRFIDVFLHWLNPKIQAAFGFKIPLTEDQIFYYLVCGCLIQFWIHKKYKKKNLFSKSSTSGGTDPKKEEK